ncbi:MAG TPA: histidinol-phosphate transaminase [Lachnospiraceae bacterium]|jgi:histidinol-phosphate aminotransferase|nr:histidinol-phosphate transaminase [Lachnospiraceae bacterium]
MKAWEKNIRKVVPYVPGEQPGNKNVVKLNTNENPYPPAPGVQKVLQEFDASRLRLYPDPSGTLLVEELARFYHLDKEQIFVGVGSDDVLAMAFMTFFNSDQPILFPNITYSFYPVWCNLFSIPYETPALDPNFCIVREDYYRENGGIVIANPNAPTSIYEEVSVIEDILRHNSSSIIIVDEAYIDFAGTSCLELINRYENLLVVQTFSKSRSMAGMRIGFAMGNPVLIQALNEVKYSFNSYTMDTVSLLTGAAAVRDEEYFRSIVQKVILTREQAKEQLKELGFSFPVSGANFIFATHERIPAKRIYEALRENDIYVRYFNMPRIDNYLRISIGTDEEMDRLFTFLRKWLNHPNA